MNTTRDYNRMKSSDKVADPFVYHFSTRRTDGTKALSHLLGGKGAHLAEMTSMGLPVPPGFTITSNMSLVFSTNGGKFPSFFKEQVKKDIKVLEETTSLKFGSSLNPLLLSVRSGSKVSMPGMMDTVLNLGMNDIIVKEMAKTESRLAWDCYRRLLQMYGDVVLGADSSMFIFILEDFKSKKKYNSDADLTAKDLEQLVQLFKDQIIETTGEEFPQDPEEQLFGAIASVFSSWNNSRAVTYRDLHDLSHDLGTAVNIQTMVFGNRGKKSATGVVFTRNPSTGTPGLFGEFLPQAQGEDVVAGIRTPLSISQTKDSLESTMPDVYKELVKVSRHLEKHFRNIQDIEFTVDQGQLWILQTRTAKRTIQASLRAGLDFVKEGLMTEEEAIMSVNPKEFESLLHPKINSQDKSKLLCQGLPASPGGATGQIVFTNQDALKKSQEKVILVRNETSPEDFQGMIFSQGIVTVRGGMTSHAAVVARGIGKCCIVGCGSMMVNAEKKECRIGSTVLREGDIITLDGTTGEVYLGEMDMVKPELDEYFYNFMDMVDRCTKITVKANADTPQDAKVAKKFGAKGIGLCRTEHMFFNEDRIDIFRKVILFQQDFEKRVQFLDELMLKQQVDFYELFKVMEGESICIRLLDPPLHEFLPQSQEEIRSLAQKWSEDPESISAKVSSLKEQNPMLGHRGCRLAVTFPELYETQVRAVVLAYLQLQAENKSCKPEIMIPLVGTVEEFRYVKSLVNGVISILELEKKVSISIPIGTMIEIPQAALRADEIAKEAAFFSFGSNDLTQTTLGISRDDCGRFLPLYIEKGILEVDPFVQIETQSVGWLIAHAVKLARKVKPDFPLSLCGEQGANPESIAFLNRIGVNSISCSAYRVPVARLSAAQASISERS